MGAESRGLGWEDKSVISERRREDGEKKTSLCQKACVTLLPFSNKATASSSGRGHKRLTTNYSYDSTQCFRSLLSSSQAVILVRTCSVACLSPCMYGSVYVRMYKWTNVLLISGHFCSVNRVSNGKINYFKSITSSCASPDESINMSRLQEATCAQYILGNQHLVMSQRAPAPLQTAASKAPARC